eukprot:SAG31_NODE_98_length_25640_cov_9.936744_27_plen_207_part_00
MTNSSWTGDNDAIEAACGGFPVACSDLTVKQLWGADEGDMIGRLAIAVLVGAIVGFQREFGYMLRLWVRQLWNGRASNQEGTRQKLHGMAGLRTHCLVALAACLFTTLSQHGFVQDVPYGVGYTGGDPARIAAQIVSGVGFLGAGTIIKSGKSDRLCVGQHATKAQQKHNKSRTAILAILLITLDHEGDMTVLICGVRRPASVGWA